MTSTFPERLREGLSLADMTQAELAKAAGVGPPLITDYIKGRYIPKAERLAKIAKALNVSEDWLMGKTDEPKRRPVQVITQHRAARIPLVGAIAGGIPMEAIYQQMDDDDPDTWEEIPADWLTGEKEYFALRVRGDSMEPDISDGDVAILERCYNWYNGAVMAVYVNGYNATLKRVRIEQNGILMLQPFNPDHETKIYTPDQQRELPVKPLALLVETRKKWR